MGSLFTSTALVFSSLFNTMAFAQELNFHGYRKFLMNSHQGTGAKLSIQTTCTTAKGQTYRVGEKNYDTCLNSAKTQLDQKQLAR